MLNEKKLAENQKRFLDLASSINRPGVESLVRFVELSDFFTAPASSVYHDNFKGGLCLHSLNVYDNLVKLNEIYGTELDDDSMKIAALFHDFAKIDFYEEVVFNKKEYCPSGRNHDSIGNFDWVATEGYRVKDCSLRSYTYGEHGVTSFILVNNFLHLTEEEMAAIINHHMGLDNGKTVADISEIYDRFPLASLLHVADTISTYINENKYRVNE